MYPYARKGLSSILIKAQNNRCWLMPLHLLTLKEDFTCEKQNEQIIQISVLVSFSE